MKALFVPVRVDALLVTNDRPVAGPFADFSRLPHVCDGADRNAETAYLSENMLSEPFDERATRFFRDSGFVLREGVHLHWALPDAMHKARTQGVVAGFDVQDGDEDLLNTGHLPAGLRTALKKAGLSMTQKPQPIVRSVVEGRWSITDPSTGRSQILRRGTTYDDDATSLRPSDNRKRFRLYSGAVTFPTVPTRWLITRRQDDVVTGQWIVESDWLSGMHDPNAKGVTYPRTDSAAGAPYGRLGRTQKRGAQTPEADGSMRLPNLTAVGYGDVNFATFYPNCHSVFGFHDPHGWQLHSSAAAKLSYDVIGWYPEPDEDILASEELADRLERLVFHYGFNEDPGDSTTGERLNALRREAIEALTKWGIDHDGSVPSRTVCHARVSIDCNEDEPPEQWCHANQLAPVKVAVGNTATEALSAYLANHAETLKHRSDGGDSKEAVRRLEESLESLYLEALLDKSPVDARSAFLQARHADEFTSVDAGVIWSIVDPDDKKVTDALLSASETAGHRLNELNRLQVVCNRRKHELDDVREQLFADWCKYISRAHPSSMFDVVPEDMRVLDPDRIAWSLDAVDLPSIVERHEVLLDALKDRDDALDALFQQLQTDGLDLKPKPVPAPRFWRPNEPVVLIAGEVAKETLRHGNDGRLSCAVHELQGKTMEDALDTAVTIAFQRAVDNATGLHSCCEQPWNPFLLEWEVRLHRSVKAEPLTDPTTGARIGQWYAPDAVTARYQLTPDGADLRLLDPDATPFEEGLHSYSGRSILTPHARLQLRRQIVRQLVVRLGPDYDAAHREQDLDLHALEPAEAFHILKPWYDALPEEKRQQRPDASVVADLFALYAQIYGKDDDHDYRILSQSLTGFNDALLMRKNTLQIPVDDPLAFPSERDFARRVAAGVQGCNRRAVQPWHDFVPVRAGHLEIAALRLVDTFGRTQDLAFAETEEDGAAGVATTTAMAVGGALDRVHLKPRLAQPARLNMRWLAARSRTGDESEMNALPVITPVCGYLLHNHVDRDVAVYDAAGVPLGALAAARGKDGNFLRWVVAPGEAHCAPWNLPNPHLRDVVRHFLEPGGVDKLERLEQHLNAIQPAGGDTSTSLAFLAGRPLAVVRVSVGLELMGLPAHDQGYRAFARILDVRLEHRTATRAAEAGIDQLRFPVRIGAHDRQNDGLVALWVETPDASGHPRLSDARYAEEDPVIELTPGGEPVTLTLLIDPRAPVHATSGIQPIKACSLPPQQYVPALSRLGLWFRVGPILTPPDRIALDLPEKPGFRWTWIENRGGAYEETDELSPPPHGAEYGAEPRLVEGWLKLTPVSEEETT